MSCVPGFPKNYVGNTYHKLLSRLTSLVTVGDAKNSDKLKTWISDPQIWILNSNKTELWFKPGFGF